MQSTLYVLVVYDEILFQYLEKTGGPLAHAAVLFFSQDNELLLTLVYKHI